MSKIQEIITLVRSGSNNSDHREGQRQIGEAVRLLNKLQTWQPIETAPKGKAVVCLRPSLCTEHGWWVAILVYFDGHWVDSKGVAFSPLYWIDIPMIAA
jgi:hypothetical protein